MDIFAFKISAVVFCGTSWFKIFSFWMANTNFTSSKLSQIWKHKNLWYLTTILLPTIILLNWIETFNSQQFSQFNSIHGKQLNFNSQFNEPHMPIVERTWWYFIVRKVIQFEIQTFKKFEWQLQKTVAIEGWYLYLFLQFFPVGSPCFCNFQDHIKLFRFWADVSHE